MQQYIEWHDVLTSLPTLQPVEGGFTNATRGIVTLPDKTRVFVKIGIGDTTRKWIQKEVRVYKTLNEYGYVHAPELLATNEDETGFALDALDQNGGWEWDTPWTQERLAATLAAMDELAAIPHSIFQQDILNDQPEDITVNPWLMPHLTGQDKKFLTNKLHEVAVPELATLLDHLQYTFQFSPTERRLVHYDVRADNCAWNPTRSKVKLVDWNWLHLGSREIDTNALLVNVYKSGLDPSVDFSDRLDRQALLWLSGYWLSSSTQPEAGNIAGRTSLRAYQFDSAVTAYKLASLV